MLNVQGIVDGFLLSAVFTAISFFSGYAIKFALKLFKTLTS